MTYETSEPKFAMETIGLRSGGSLCRSWRPLAQSDDENEDVVLHLFLDSLACEAGGYLLPEELEVALLRAAAA